ncbi:MAG: hypothetical protein ACUZ8I_10330 [Candidatus Scalindua sp.]
MSINHPKNKEFKVIYYEIMNDNGMNDRLYNDIDEEEGLSDSEKSEIYLAEIEYEKQRQEWAEGQ